MKDINYKISSFKRESKIKMIKLKAQVIFQKKKTEIFQKKKTEIGKGEKHRFLKISFSFLSFLT